jgi:hypothetical protein
MDASEIWCSMRIKLVSLHAAALKSNIMVTVPFGDGGTNQAAEKPSIKLDQNGELWLASSNAATWDTSIAVLTVGDVYTVVLHGRGGAAGALTQEAYLYDDTGTLVVPMVSNAWAVGTTGSNNVTKWGNSGGGNTTGLRFFFSEMTVFKGVSTNPGPSRVDALDPSSTVGAGNFTAFGAATLHEATDENGSGARTIADLSSTSASTQIGSASGSLAAADVGAQIVNHLGVTNIARRITTYTNPNLADVDGTAGTVTNAGSSAVIVRRGHDGEVTYAVVNNAVASTMELGLTNLSRIDSDDEIHTVIPVMIQRHTGSSPVAQIGIKSGATSSLQSFFPSTSTQYNRRRGQTGTGSSNQPSQSLDPATAARWTAAGVDAATLLIRDNDALAREFRITKAYVIVVAAQIPPAGGGQSADVLQTTETDVAQPITATKSRALGQVTSSSVAQSVAELKSKLLGQTVEASTAQAVARAKQRVVGQSLETDVALAVGRSKLKLLGQVTEADEARTMGTSSSIFIAVGQATEISTAQPIGRAKAKLLGQTLETDASFVVGHSRTRAVGLAIELSSATALGRLKRRALGQITGLDAAQPITPLRLRPVGLALELDAAVGMTARKARAVAQALEVDTALVIIAQGGLIIVITDVSLLADWLTAGLLEAGDGVLPDPGKGDII